MLRRVKPYIPKEYLNLLYKSLVQPHLDYCSQIWSGRFQMHIAKLEKLQKRAARIILNKDYHTPSVELFQEHKWMPLNKRFIYNRAVLMFKCLNNLAPEYMSDEFTQTIQTHGYNTRHAQNSLVMPKLRTECLLNSPFVTGISVWNNLDQSVKSEES